MPKDLQLPTVRDIFSLKFYHGLEVFGSTTSNTVVV